MSFFYSGPNASLITSAFFNVTFLIVMVCLVFYIYRQKRQLAAIRRQLSRLFDAYERSPIIRGSQRISSSALGSEPENNEEENEADQEGFVNIRL